ncbi:MAG: ribosomal subunit interface protein [Candidatus Kerfeldbacteria bacterium RIFCSPHIGHO2_12_FULL_48_17]|uniref:Ribosomal subunit interface protein n=1 Tax=Candidatus Kerfeldbacteria bacterium RIFCSPHIGHO2_12_FULL_48_17 TaxID=1798542 RepID=A0A1G2AYR3_9BACT|nr:MAG: ribosomal subunit interface protein [Candidatus Kerfeldbacteria bacterium RIFCSPHIGHO2_12_FULL_48_17]
MNAQIHAKNCELNEVEEDYIHRKLQNLEKIHENIIAVKVDVAKDAHHKTGYVYTMKVHVSVPKQLLMAEEVGSTVQQAVDLIENELTRQLKRYKEKLISKNIKAARLRRE